MQNISLVDSQWRGLTMCLSKNYSRHYSLDTEMAQDHQRWLTRAEVALERRDMEWQWWKSLNICRTLWWWCCVCSFCFVLFCFLRRWRPVFIEELNDADRLNHRQGSGTGGSYSLSQLHRFSDIKGLNRELQWVPIPIQFMRYTWLVQSLVFL